ncbi:MAG: methylenetetrahydrofolate reductase [NAD(P)H] [Bacteroidales bacterium]|nr:methylenetetrahydrofolate reductase [NAD(P)H] [Bacteroidales bacterium]
MSVSEILQKTDKTLFSFEVLPPLRGKSIDQIYKTVDKLMPFHPAFIEITTHRSDFVYKEVAPGQFKRVEERVRPGTVAIAYAIKQKYGLPVVPHMICSGYSQQETENELLDLAFLGLTDLLVLRGDKSKQDSRFIPKEGGLKYASELCEQVNAFNEGHLLFGESHELCREHPFSYGVAGYPEKHEEAMSQSADMRALKRKVDLGAGYIVTQMFFDNQKYFDFVQRCREAGITVPIVPGLKPLSTLNHCTMLPRTFHIDFPDELVQKLEKCASNEEVKQVGIEWCVRQCRELKEHGVPSLHFYSMNAAAQIETILNLL